MFEGFLEYFSRASGVGNIFFDFFDRLLGFFRRQGRGLQNGVRNVLKIFSVGLGARTGGYFVGDAYVPAGARHQRRHQALGATGRTLYMPSGNSRLSFLP